MRDIREILNFISPPLSQIHLQTEPIWYNNIYTLVTAREKP
jgi:hypothetical protein